MFYKKLAISFASIMLLGITVFAQEAKIPVKVQPHQAYVFLDGVAIKDGDVTLKTTPGEHTIAVYNYGFQGQERRVTAQAGKNEAQTFTLEKAGADVSSPYGYIQIEGPNAAAVLLNGTTPDYLVGHVDEFNNHIIWKQQLIVPVGTHQLLVTREGKTMYAGPIEVAAGQRVIVNVYEGKTRTQAVDSGSGVTRPRFEVGTASAAIAIAPVSGSFAANPAQIDCNQTSQLVYSSTETLHSNIKNSGEVRQLPTLTGELPVSPHQTTLYNFEASGPGGFVRQDATVNVNPVITSSLETSPAEVHYLKIGDKILTQESTDLKWNVHNADAISVEPVGKVAATVPGTSMGQEKLTAEPKPVTGTVDETKTYILQASNVCGGTDSKTAQLRIKGMIEPYILSVFFPTGYPTRHKPEVGLVASQQDSLMKLAKAFPIYAEHTPDAKLIVRGYADPRGGNRYNLKLSERRIAAVKSFLVAQGIPEDKISMVAFGDTKGLDTAMVHQLEAENPFKAGAAGHTDREIRLAYNRRIDVELQPVGVESARFFPHEVNDADLLVKPAFPRMNTVLAAQQAISPKVIASTE